MTRQGIVLLSHGSRDPLWRAPMEAVQARIQAERPDLLVRSAYLELCPPSLPAAVAELAAAGACRITIVPMFLGTGRHARNDLPRLVDALRQAHPRLRFHVQQAIGEDERMTVLMARIATETNENEG